MLFKSLFQKADCHLRKHESSLSVELEVYSYFFKSKTMFFGTHGLMKRTVNGRTF